MEFRHLQTFQAIAQAGSFLKAAEKLQYAQSTITLHIQQLENELGVKLFSRRGKRTELTVAGRTLQSHAHQLLYRATQLQQAMTDLVAGEAGQLRIGSVEPVASVHLPAILVGFCRQHPKVRLTLEVGVTKMISQHVAAGDLDLAICSPPAANLGLEFEFLFQDPISLLVPTPHPLANTVAITVASLAEERLILTEEYCPYREVLEKALLPHGINPFSGIEVMSLEALKQMVHHGLGIGVMPTAAILSPPPDTVVQRIANLELQLPIGLVMSPEVALPGSVLQSLVEDLKTGLSNSNL
ncbi:MAG: LysR family transcriptional regulator [Cyanobacteria bacterium J06559_3]